MQIISLADKKAFIKELAELHHAEWGHFNPSFTLKMRAEALEKAAGQRGVPSIFIAISDGELMGSAALVAQDMGNTRPELSPWLAAVYVKESFRGQGIASTLIARCEAEAVQAGAKTWYLFTEFASGLYEKLGWQLLEHCEYKGVSVSVMSRHIA